MYKKVKDLMAEYSISRSTVRLLLSEMEEANRYPNSAIIGGSCIRVDADCFQDYMENRRELKHPTMKKYVKPFRR